MAYIKQTWINDDENSQLSAERLNHIESGIFNAHNLSDNLEASFALLLKSFDGDVASSTPANNLYLSWDLTNKRVGLNIGKGTYQPNDEPLIQRTINVDLSGILTTNELETNGNNLVLSTDNTKVPSAGAVSSALSIVANNVKSEVVVDVQVNGLSIVNNTTRVANIVMPTKLSDLQDDLDYTRLKVKTASDSLDDVRINDFIFLVED